MLKKNVAVHVFFSAESFSVSIAYGGFCDKTSETEVFLELLICFAMWEPKFNPPFQPRNENFEVLSIQFFQIGP